MGVVGRDRAEAAAELFRGWFLTALADNLFLRLGGGSVALEDPPEDPVKDPPVLPFEHSCMLGDFCYGLREASKRWRPAPPHCAQPDSGGSLRGIWRRENVPSRASFIFGDGSVNNEGDLRTCAVWRHLNVDQLELRHRRRKLFCHGSAQQELALARD